MKYLKSFNITKHFVNFLTMIDDSRKIQRRLQYVLIQRLGFSFFSLKSLQTLKMCRQNEKVKTTLFEIKFNKTGKKIEIL